MLILAIDPGPERSSWVLWDTEQERVATGEDQVANINVRLLLADLVVRLELHHGIKLPAWPTGNCWAQPPCQVVIERPVVMGRKKRPTVEIVETAYQAGVFEGAWPGQTAKLTYHRVRSHLTRDVNANEAAVKLTLVERFGLDYGKDGKGTKKAPGPFYGVAGHMWSALAVAVAWWDLVAPC